MVAKCVCLPARSLLSEVKVSLELPLSLILFSQPPGLSLPLLLHHQLLLLHCLLGDDLTWQQLLLLTRGLATHVGTAKR